MRCLYCFSRFWDTDPGDVVVSFRFEYTAAETKLILNLLYTFIIHNNYDELFQEKRRQVNENDSSRNKRANYVEKKIL